MIQIITGDIGTGKTKQMITLANDKSNDCKGQVVYIDSTSQHRLHLSHRIRLIEANTFPITANDFFGFLCGVLSSNHDIECIFIDELVKLTRMSIDELASLMERLKNLSLTYQVDLIVGASCSHKDIPKDLLMYLVA